jgi:hypothetical protein
MNVLPGGLTRKPRRSKFAARKVSTFVWIPAFRSAPPNRRGFNPPIAAVSLICPPGTFSQREKALYTLSHWEMAAYPLSHRERVRVRALPAGDEQIFQFSLAPPPPLLKLLIVISSMYSTV